MPDTMAAIAASGYGIQPACDTSHMPVAQIKAHYAQSAQRVGVDDLDRLFPNKAVSLFVDPDGTLRIATGGHENFSFELLSKAWPEKYDKEDADYTEAVGDLVNAVHAARVTYIAGGAKANRGGLRLSIGVDISHPLTFSQARVLRANSRSSALRQDISELELLHSNRTENSVGNGVARVDARNEQDRRNRGKGMG